MTSIEWLKKELEYFGDPDRCIISWEELDSLIEQAERINQKQLIVEIMEEDSKDGLYDIPLQECVNCNEQKQVHLMCLDCCIKLGNQNQTEISEPNPQLIESMSYRYRHDFGLLQDDKKNVIRTIMKQLWEEVVGKGFYKPTKHQVPDVRKMVEWIDREILLNPHYADSPRLKEGANMVKVKLQQYTPTSSQTEISDEEIEKIINYLFPNKSKWIDISMFDRDGYYKLIQMRIRLDNNKKEFRIANIGFINDNSVKWKIHESVLSNGIKDN